MDIEIGGHLGVDLAQEREELGGAVTCVQRADDLAGGQIQAAIEARGAVADLVVAGSRWSSGQHREHRLGPVQRLDLVFSSTQSTNARSGGSR